MPVLVGLRSGGVLRIDGKTVDASEVQLSDIAYGLGSLQRFGGQLDRPYSVAEHSVILSEIHPDPLDYGQRIAALFHDAAECLGAGDVNAFLKTKEAAKVEKSILDAVLGKFAVEPYRDRELDRWLGNHEATHITPAKRHWEKPEAKAKQPMYRHWGTTDAAANWTARYHWYRDAAAWLQSNDLAATVATLIPGRPFDGYAVCDRYKGIDPVAVISVLKSLPSIKELPDGKFTVQGG